MSQVNLPVFAADKRRADFVSRKIQHVAWSCRKLIYAFVTLFIAHGFAAGAGATELPSDPKLFIKNISEKAIAVIQQTEGAPSERRQSFRDLFNTTFDVSRISRFTLGRYWNRAAVTEREEYQALFVDFLVESYASRITGYNGETLSIEKATPKKKGDVVVRSHLLRPGQESIRLDWRLRNQDGNWLVVDIIAEGISLALTHRSEFASVIRKHGGDVSGLIDLMRNRITEARKTSSS